MFTRESTTEDVLEGLDLSGRRVVITGASSGLGEESARALAGHGASVVMLARDEAKNRAAAERIRSAQPDADLELAPIDLGDLRSVRACADELLSGDGGIDVLMNNAGVMACPEGRTADGFETQFGTNHLAHFVLTGMLVPRILESPDPRVVILSSAGHERGDVDLDDPMFDRTPYDPWVAYGRSKSANALHAVELANRLGPRGLLAVSVHPGGVGTSLGRHLTEDMIAAAIERAQQRASTATQSVAMKPVEQGAATQVWAATSDGLRDHNGAYLADCQVGVEGGQIGATGYLPHITDAGTASRLWNLSEELVGQTFDFT